MGIAILGWMATAASTAFRGCRGMSPECEGAGGTGVDAEAARDAFVRIEDNGVIRVKADDAGWTEGVAGPAVNAFVLIDFQAFFEGGGDAAGLEGVHDGVIVAGGDLDQDLPARWLDVGPDDVQGHALLEDDLGGEGLTGLLFVESQEYAGHFIVLR
jgi:hypothetical protein